MKFLLSKTLPFCLFLLLFLFQRNPYAAQIDCNDGDDGELVSFSFSKPDFDPDFSVVDYPEFSSRGHQTPGEGGQAQLDICFYESPEGFSFKLKQVVLVDSDSNVTTYTADGMSSSVEGLTKAMIEDDLGQLHIRMMKMVFAIDGTFGKGFEIKAWKGQTGTFLTLALLNQYGREIVDTTTSYLVGVLKEGQVSAGTKCGPGENFKVDVYQIGAARIRAETCYFDQGDQTTGLRYIRVEIQDEDPRLPEDLRSLVNVIESDKISKQVSLLITHHNMYDQAEFRLDHASYRWSIFEYKLYCQVRYDNGTGDWIDYNSNSTCRRD